jgi:signal transduction histidine kinase
MRERLRELEGRLEIESDASGTLIRAVIHISGTVKATKSGSA